MSFFVTWYITILSPTKSGTTWKLRNKEKTKNIVSTNQRNIYMEKILQQKLTVAQLVQKFRTFMEPEHSLPHSQEHATDPYPEPDESNPYHQNLLPECLF
jgi:hypothetical protein